MAERYPRGGVAAMSVAVADLFAERIQFAFELVDPLNRRLDPGVERFPLFLLVPLEGGDVLQA